VPLFLRILGITNAAVWFGASVFLVLAVWPAFSGADMLKILPPGHSGAAAHVILERFFLAQYLCGGIALCHLALEWLYAGKPLRTWTLYLVGGLLGLALLSGLLVQPKLERLHFEVYGTRSTQVQREQAGRSLGFWQGLLRFSNLVMVAGLWTYLWQVQGAGNSARFVSAGKLRGLTNGVS
jgi:hypothetical protein